MNSNQTLLVATCGQGILRTVDEGENWSRLPIFQDIEYDDIVRTLVIHPTEPATIFAGFHGRQQILQVLFKILAKLKLPNVILSEFRL